MTRAKRPPPDRRRAALLLVALSSVVATLLAGELGIRIARGDYRLIDFRAESRELFQRALPVEFDAELGWVPRPGTSHEDNVWRSRVTILPGGLRAPGPDARPGAAAAGALLAVGDSFTFGDQVSDGDTWPARLAGHLGRPVLNAGVFGYGVDQTWLRMQRLHRELEPRGVIFSLIDADIGRSELRVRSAVPKPYFELRDGQLVLRTEHVKPPPARAAPAPSPLGYSLLAHRILGRLLPGLWLEGGAGTLRAHDRGEAVACAIFRRFTGFLDANPGLPLHLLIQDTQRPAAAAHARLDRVLACVEDPRVRIHDVRPALAALREREPTRYDALFDTHMTAAGNAWLAAWLAPRLSDQAGRPAPIRSTKLSK